MYCSIRELVCHYNIKSLKSIDRSRGVNVSMTPFHRDFHVPFHLVYVDYDVLWGESKLSESIVAVIGVDGMASVRTNVHSLNSSFRRQR